MSVRTVLNRTLLHVRRGVHAARSWVPVLRVVAPIQSVCGIVRMDGPTKILVRDDTRPRRGDPRGSGLRGLARRSLYP